jgi:hypothetical protein
MVDRVVHVHEKHVGVSAPDDVVPFVEGRKQDNLVAAAAPLHLVDPLAGEVGRWSPPGMDEEIDMSDSAAPSTPSDTGERRFYHGTQADLKSGDLIQPGHASNYTERRSPWIYFSETLEAATWGAELAKGTGPGRIYVVEPIGSFMDDPNLTDRKYPGNPTRSYRSRDPLRVVREQLNWQGHSAAVILAMKDGIAGLQPIDD